MAPAVSIPIRTAALMEADRFSAKTVSRGEGSGQGSAGGPKGVGVRCCHAGERARACEGGGLSVSGVLERCATATRGAVAERAIFVQARASSMKPDAPG